MPSLCFCFMQLCLFMFLCMCVFSSMSQFYSLNPGLNNTAGLVSEDLSSSAVISGRPPMPNQHVCGLWEYKLLVLMLKHQARYPVGHLPSLFMGLKKKCLKHFLFICLTGPKLSQKLTYHVPMLPYNLTTPLLGIPLGSKTLGLQKYLGHHWEVKPCAYRNTWDRKLVRWLKGKGFAIKCMWGSEFDPWNPQNK